MIEHKEVCYYCAKVRTMNHYGLLSHWKTIEKGFDTSTCTITICESCEQLKKGKSIQNGAVSVPIK